jgi:hypothetical protein
MNIAMFALIHLCVNVNAKDRIAGQSKEHVFSGKIIISIFFKELRCIILFVHLNKIIICETAEQNKGLLMDDSSAGSSDQEEPIDVKVVLKRRRFWGKLHYKELS